MRKPRESEFAWLTRAVIIAALLWAGSTLYSVDTRMGILEYRMTIIEGHHNE